MAKRGHQVLHFCPVPPRGDHLRADYERVRFLGTREAGLWPAVDPSTTIKILEARPDVLYVHRTVNLSALPPRLLRLIPTIVDAHGSEYMEYQAFGELRKAAQARLLEQFTLRTADAVIAASDELRDFLIPTYGLPDERIEVVQNGIPETTLVRPYGGADWKSRLGLREDTVLVLVSAPGLYAANDLSMSLLSQVAKLLHEGGHPVHLAASGRSTAPPGISALGIVDDYLGLVDAADIALLPFPPAAVCGGARNKTLEFLARGKAVISTREGMRGVRGATAGTHYVLAESPHEVSSAISELAEDPTARSRLGGAAKNLAAGFLWSESALRLDNVFRHRISG